MTEERKITFTELCGKGLFDEDHNLCKITVIFDGFTYNIFKLMKELEAEGVRIRHLAEPGGINDNEQSITITEKGMEHLRKSKK